MKKFVSNRAYIGFILPGLIGLTFFYVIPYVDTFRRAFYSSSGTTFVGLDSFKSTIANESFQLATVNTIKFVIVCVPLLLLLSFCVGYYIYNRLPEDTYVKTLFMSPMAMPVASIVVMWKILFARAGLINAVLTYLGMNPIDWMDSDCAFYVLVLSYIWKNLGYNIILWIAGLSMIPGTLYEAARIDGASEKIILFRITLPNLTDMISIISIIALLNSFKMFREAYLVAGNYPHESIYMLQHIMNNWFRDLSLDKIAAASFMLSIVCIFFVIILRRMWGHLDEK